MLNPPLPAPTKKEQRIKTIQTTVKAVQNTWSRNRELVIAIAFLLIGHFLR